jgi:hypothetical protein
MADELSPVQADAYVLYGHGAFPDVLALTDAHGGVQQYVRKDLAARTFARQGGQATSEAKRVAARANGRRGGRPRKSA